MIDYLKIKTEILAACKESLDEKQRTLDSEMQSLQDALHNETKSSAGDKYETGPEMIQLQKEKILKQQQMLNLNHQLLNRSYGEHDTEKILVGSFVITNVGCYLIGPSIGKVTIDKNHYFVVSPSSPIAQVFINKQKGDKISFNGNDFEILKVV